MIQNMQGVFDLGGTGYRVASLGEQGELINVGFGETKQSYKDGLAKLILDLEQSGASNKLAKVAGAIAGKLDPSRKKIDFSPNLPSWVGKPLQDDLQKELGCEVILENDAVAEGLGEAVEGAGKGFSKVGYLTAGTGIGGAFIDVSRDFFQLVDLEPGWTYKIGDNFLEEVAGGKAMEMKYEKKPEEINNPEIWSLESKYLAEGINKLISDWQPDITVLNGSLLKSINWNELASQVNGKIVKGCLDQLAGLYGSRQLLRQGQR